MSDSTTQTRDSDEQTACPPEEWVDRYGDFLFRRALLRVRRENVAEELVQETLLAALQSLDRYEGRGDQRAWLAGILRHKVLDYFRAQSRRNRKHLATMPDADISERLFDETGNWRPGAMGWVPQPDSEAQLRELWRIILACLKTLPAKQAMTFTLIVMERMDRDQVCDTLEITPSNLWVRLHRARLALAHCVGNKWSIDGPGGENVE